MKWTEQLVFGVLRDAYLPKDYSQTMDEWALLPHVPLRTPDGHNERIIDALAVRCWASGKGFERIAYEIKVSRSDYRNDTDTKRAPAEVSAHWCAYVVPAGLIRPDEVPPGWGLLYVFEDRDVYRPHALGPQAAWQVKPVRRTPTCDLDYLVSAGFRRGSRAEDLIRSGAVPAAEYVRMQEEVQSLRGIADRAVARANREEQRAKQARSELLSVDGATECADCGQAITWKRGGQQDSRWTHVKPLHDKPCSDRRREADRIAKERETGAAYAWGFPGNVEPAIIREARLAAALEDAQEAAS